jgi:protein-S-isoprenylcysteine O-methyltransferase Ste14
MAAFKWVYRMRGYLVALPIVVATFSFHHETESELIWPIGGLLFLCGFALRIWAQQHLHYRIEVHKVLTTTGPYAYVRNPIYIGNILILLAATVMSELLWFLPITFLYSFTVYSLVIGYEEAHLLEKYGEPYQHYLKRVPRWIPKGLPPLKDFGLTTPYLPQSLLAEIHCLLLPLPLILKELVGS